MSNKKQITETVSKPNHLEELFGLPSGSTEMTITKNVTDTEEIELYDEKDTELDKQFDVVGDMAEYTYEVIQDSIKDVEPKYSARLHEVASTYLNIKLEAIKNKAKLKIEKDKLHAKKTSPTKVSHTTNNTIISNTSDLIDSLRKQQEANSINGEFSITQESIDDEDTEE